jgi:uncharacterized protein YjbI with pentapeptide repeats
MLKLAWPWQSERGSGGSRRLPPLDLHGAALPRVDLSDTDLEGANFAGTDLTGADLRRVNLRNAKLKGAILRGTDLREAENLTWEQLADAVIDETTRLPADLAAAARGNAASRGEVT